MTHKLTPDEMLFLGEIREKGEMWLDEVKEILKMQYNARVNAVRAHLGCTCKTYGKGMNKKCKANEHIYNELKYKDGRKSSKFYYIHLTWEARQAEQAILQPEPSYMPKKPNISMSWDERREWFQKIKKMDQIRERIDNGVAWRNTNKKHPKYLEYGQLIGELEAEYHKLKQETNV